MSIKLQLLEYGITVSELKYWFQVFALKFPRERERMRHRRRTPGYCSVQFSSIPPSCHINSLWPQGLKHVGLPCLSPTPGACSNSCPSSWWCLPTISSSVVPFSSCLQSFPASGSFPMSQFFASGGQNTGASASASVLYYGVTFKCHLVLELTGSDLQ